MRGLEREEEKIETERRGEERKEGELECGGYDIN